MTASNVIQLRPTKGIGTSMSDVELNTERDFWIRRLASRLIGELPTSHNDALLVMTYMAEFLTHTDHIAVPVEIETARSVLKFDRKDNHS